MFFIFSTHMSNFVLIGVLFIIRSINLFFMHNLKLQKLEI